MSAWWSYLFVCVCLVVNTYIFVNWTLAWWLECSPMAQETWVQSQVESYQRQKWYLIPPCLTLSNIRYLSRVKWSNPRKGVAPFPTPWCSSYWKGSLLVALDYGCQLYFLCLWFIGIYFIMLSLMVSSQYPAAFIYIILL